MVKLHFWASSPPLPTIQLQAMLSLIWPFPRQSLRPSLKVFPTYQCRLSLLISHSSNTWSWIDFLIFHGKPQPVEHLYKSNITLGFKASCSGEKMGGVGRERERLSLFSIYISQDWFYNQILQNNFQPSCQKCWTEQALIPLHSPGILPRQ